MLYFLNQTFNMHEIHIHSFLTHFPFLCYNDTNFECYRFLVQTEQCEVGLFFVFRFSLFVFRYSFFVFRFSLFAFRFSLFVFRFSFFVLTFKILF